MIKVVRIISSVLIVAFIMVLNASKSYAKIGDYVMVCGETPNGQPISCNTASHKCLYCEYNTIKTKWLRWAGNRKSFIYECHNKSVRIPGNCTQTTKGGQRGESYTQALLWEVNRTEGIDCVTSNFLSMYQSSCYGCEIVEILASAFVKAAAKAYDVSRKAGNVILTVATLIWIAIFVLKNVSSFATVEPRQMIQQLMIQLFKVLLAFVIVNSGIKTILHYTVEPLMLAGTDFADAILIETTEEQ